MKMVRLDPPGAHCLIQAVIDRLGGLRGATVLDVGCGAGSLLAELCRRGFDATGVDSAPEAIAVAERTLAAHLSSGRCRLITKALEELGPESRRFDVALSMMTLEHVDDDAAFVRRLAGCARPGGWVIVSAAARRDRWGFEDEVVGHQRRYERNELERLLQAAGLVGVEVWSVSVPVANLLFHAGTLLVRRSTDKAILRLGRREQTATSGIREVPFKTAYPAAFRVLLNPVAMAPLFWLQRRFYHTSLGLIALAAGRVPIGVARDGESRPDDALTGSLTRPERDQRDSRSS